MSTSTISAQIQRLQGIKAAIRTKLYNMGLVQSSASLADCQTAIEGIADRGTPSVTLDASTTSTSFAAGYYHGGTVSITPESLTGANKITSNGTYTPTLGKVITEINVDVGVPYGFADVVLVDANASDVLAGKIFVEADGTVTTGTMLNNQAANLTINPLDGQNTTSRNIPIGFHNGNGTVSLTGDLLTALEGI